MRSQCGYYAHGSICGGDLPLTVPRECRTDKLYAMLSRVSVCMCVVLDVISNKSTRMFKEIYANSGCAAKIQYELFNIIGIVFYFYYAK